MVSKHDKKSRENKAVQVANEIKKFRANDAAEAADSRRCVLYRGKELRYTDDQQRFDEETFSVNAMFNGAAGSGKTLMGVKWIRQIFDDKERDSRVWYFALNQQLIDDVSPEFSEKDRHTSYIKLLTWPTFIGTLKTLGVEIKIPDRLIKPTDYAYFKEWIDKQKTLLFYESTNSNDREKKSIHLSQWNSEALYSEFIYTILRPSGDLSVAYLSEKEYMELGQYQSYFPKDERKFVYYAFRNYLKTIDRTTHYEPHEQFFEIFKAIKIFFTTLSVSEDKKRHDAILRALFNVLYIDEMQQLHPWQAMCLLLIASKIKAVFHCGLDPHQIDVQRIDVINSYETIFTFLNIACPMRFLPISLRCDSHITAFAKLLLLAKHALYGTASRKDYVEIQLTLEEPLGTLSAFAYSDVNDTVILPSELTIKPTTMVLAFSSDDVNFCRRRLRLPNVVSYEAASGRQWDEVVILLRTKDFDFPVSDFCNENMDRIFQSCIEQINLSIPNSRRATFVLPHLQLQRMVNLLYLLTTRGCHSVVILSDEPAMSTFFNSVFSRLKAKMHALIESAPAVACAMEPENNRLLESIGEQNFYPDDWVDIAKTHLNDKNPEIIAAGQAILWSAQVWLTDERAENAKQLYEMIKKKCTVTEIDFVQTFAMELSELIEKSVSVVVIEQKYRNASNKIVSTDFGNSIDSLRTIVSEEFDKQEDLVEKPDCVEGKSDIVTKNAPLPPPFFVSVGLFSAKTTDPDLDLILNVKKALRRPGDLNSWQEKVIARLSDTKMPSSENHIELYLLYIALGNKPTQQILNNIHALIDRIPEKNKYYYYEEFAYLLFLSNIDITFENKTKKSILIPIYCKLQILKKTKDSRELQQAIDVLKNKFDDLEQNLSQGGTGFGEKALTVIANALLYFDQKTRELSQVNLLARDQKHFVAAFKQLEGKLINLVNKGREYAENHMKVVTNDGTPLRDLSMHPMRLLFLYYLLDSNKNLGDYSELLTTFVKLFQHGAYDAREQLKYIQLAQFSLRIDLKGWIACFSDVQSELPSKWLILFLVLYYLLWKFFPFSAINSYEDFTVPNILMDSFKNFVFLPLLCIILVTIVCRPDFNQLRERWEGKVEKIYLTVDPPDYPNPEERTVTTFQPKR